MGRVDYFADSLPGFAEGVSPSGHRSYVLTYTAASEPSVSALR